MIPSYNTGRSHLIQLNTLVWLRWSAIIGQMGAVCVALWHFELALPVGVIAALIGVLIISNLFFHVVYPRPARADDTLLWAVLMLDVVQFCALIAVTGGIHNPFAMLVLAPVSIGASVLPFRQAITISVVSAILVSGAAVYYVPLVDAQGVVLAIPDLLMFGVWTALIIGIAFISVYAFRVSSEIHIMNEALIATQEALAREQKLTDLAGVVAATAHELGTPLATIKLVSSELSDLLSSDPELKADAQLIRDQADRCRDIMREMGQAAKTDDMIKWVPIQALVENAATPHMARGIHVDIQTTGDTKQPEIPRIPEIVHGLRNLIQNAVDHADQQVTIAINWSVDDIIITVRDDGPGFPAHILHRLGDPLKRRKRRTNSVGYEGMGLGVFIAKTLLGRTGARLRFANGTGIHQGAIVEVSWPKTALKPL